MKIGSFIILLGFFWLAGSIVYATVFTDYSPKEVPCKDSSGNEMPDTKCIEDKDWEDATGIILIGITIFIFSVLMGYIINQQLRRLDQLQKKILEEFGENHE